MLPTLARKAPLVLLALALFAKLPSPAQAGDFELFASSHALLWDFGGDLQGVADLSLAASWSPMVGLALGVETVIGVPLHTGDALSHPDVVLRANPAVWLRFGDLQSWGFIKLGLGVESLMEGSHAKAVPVAVGAAGFGVAPPSLLLYFGFELTGQYHLGKIISRSAGLGGFMGYRF